MSKQRHRRRSQGGTTPETTPQTGSGVAHFSVSEVAQFWMSVDIHGKTNPFNATFNSRSQPPKPGSSLRIKGIPIGQPY